MANPKSIGFKVFDSGTLRVNTVTTSLNADPSLAYFRNFRLKGSESITAKAEYIPLTVATRHSGLIVNSFPDDLFPSMFLLVKIDFNWTRVKDFKGAYNIRYSGPYSSCRIISPNGYEKSILYDGEVIDLTKFFSDQLTINNLIGE